MQENLAQSLVVLRKKKKRMERRVKMGGSMKFYPCTVIYLSLSLSNICSLAPGELVSFIEASQTFD